MDAHTVAVPLERLSFTLRQATLDFDSAAGIRFSDPDSLRDFKATFYLRIPGEVEGPDPKPDLSLSQSQGKIDLQFSRLKVSDSEGIGASPPGYSLAPHGARLIRIGNFGVSRYLDRQESVSFGMYDQAAQARFAIAYVDRAATLTFDTVLCGLPRKSTIVFPGPGFYAIGQRMGPDSGIPFALAVSADLVYFASVNDFIYNTRVEAKSGCVDPIAEKAAFVGDWKRVSGGAYGGSGLTRLIFRADDSLFQLHEDTLGVPTRIRKRFAPSGKRLKFDHSDYLEYSFSERKDTLRLLDFIQVFVRDTSGDAPSEWIRELKVMDSLPVELDKVYGMTWGAGSLFLKTYSGFFHTLVTRMDSSGRIQDTMLFRSADYRTDNGSEGMGMAVQGDSILWITGKQGALRRNLKTRDSLPAFNPGPPPAVGYFSSSNSILGMDGDRIWTTDWRGNLLGWTPDSLDIDTVVPSPRQNLSAMQVTGGKLYFALANQVYVRELTGKRIQSTYQLDSGFEFNHIQVQGSTLWAVMTPRNGVGSPKLVKLSGLR